MENTLSLKAQNVNYSFTYPGLMSIIVYKMSDFVHCIGHSVRFLPRMTNIMTTKALNDYYISHYVRFFLENTIKCYINPLLYHLNGIYGNNSALESMLTPVRCSSQQLLKGTLSGIIGHNSSFKVLYGE